MEVYLPETKSIDPRSLQSPVPPEITWYTLRKLQDIRNSIGPFKSRQRLSRTLEEIYSTRLAIHLID